MPQTFFLCCATICCCVLLCWADTTPQYRRAAKISLGTDKTSSSVDNSIIPFRPPKPYWGPEALTFLSGQCFFASFDRYLLLVFVLNILLLYHYLNYRNDYTVCPFMNVTQRRTSMSTALSKPTVLGVWNSWKVPPSSDAEDTSTNNNAPNRFGYVLVVSLFYIPHSVVMCIICTYCRLSLIHI